jgi:hypothetical protein
MDHGDRQAEQVLAVVTAAAASPQPQTGPRHQQD